MFLRRFTFKSVILVVPTSAQVTTLSSNTISLLGHSRMSSLIGLPLVTKLSVKEGTKTGKTQVSSYLKLKKKLLCSKPSTNAAFHTSFYDLAVDCLVGVQFYTLWFQGRGDGGGGGRG